MTTETVTAGTAGTLSLDARRVDLAREAAHEVLSISVLLREVIAREQDEATMQALARGMLARVQVLASAASDSLDPRGGPTDDIEAEVYCLRDVCRYCDAARDRQAAAAQLAAGGDRA